VYDYLEPRDIGYAIRLPANEVLQEHIKHLLKRLGWVEATGEQEISEVQDLMALEPGEEERQTGQAHIYYRITRAGSAAPESVIADPIQAIYEYPREVRSAKAKRLV